ncbi:hypothetical protein [Streptomyces sp. MMS24-I29]|uniref:HD domain-containing protein n=1 Tax=Streptomyces sp. MMS24-I29 TaxID=3351480 RepID=UPI003C7B8FAD
MSVLSTAFPRVPLKRMDPALLVFELDRETQRVMPVSSELITSAATMVSYLHRDQLRFVRGDMPKVPYIEHPLRVALRLIRWGVRDPFLVAAALLHDVVEDCADELITRFGRPGDSPVQCLSRLYGPVLAGYVMRVTNPAEGDVVAGAEAYQAHVTELAWSGSAAVLIKASDLKDNAGSIRHQLGHEKDACMLRMLRKYLPVVQEVATAPSTVGLPDQPGTAQAAAASDMHELAKNLDALAAEHDVA